MMICPLCQHSNPPTLIHCERCLTALPTMARQSATVGRLERVSSRTAAPRSAAAVVALPPRLQTVPITRQQQYRCFLQHGQTGQRLPIPEAATVVYLGKPNLRCPPTLDLSQLPDADIISRVHSAIGRGRSGYYIEDMGSANGTFLNHHPLLAGIRRPLCSGDLISLGKGDKVTFSFHAQLE